jgi:hypothetical protein
MSMPYKWKLRFKKDIYHGYDYNKHNVISLIMINIGVHQMKYIMNGSFFYKCIFLKWNIVQCMEFS